MPLTYRWMQRWTWWYDQHGEAVQVSVAVLDSSDWEPQSVVTEHIGPFDDPTAIARTALQAAENLARGQLPGQQALTV